MLTTDNVMPFKFGVATYPYIESLIELFAGEDHGIELGTTTHMGETWIELHCDLPRELRKGLRQVFYPTLITGDRNTRRMAMRGRVDRGTMYAAVFPNGKSLAKGDMPLGVPTIGALVDLLVERRAVLERDRSQDRQPHQGESTARH